MAGQWWRRSLPLFFQLFTYSMYFFPSSPLTRSRPLFSRILLRSAVRLSLVGVTCSPPTTPCCSPLRQDRSSSQLLHSDLRGMCMRAAEESEAGGSSRDIEVAVCLQLSWHTPLSLFLQVTPTVTSCSSPAFTRTCRAATKPFTS